MRNQEHTFANGDKLFLDVSDGYAGLCGLPVYTVCYGFCEKNHRSESDHYQSVGSDQFLDEAEAQQAFESRIHSENPAKPIKSDSGIYGIVQDVLSRYLGNGVGINPPTEWDAFVKHITQMTFHVGETRDYDGARIVEILQRLDTVSAQRSDGLSETQITIPAWKLLEMMAAITALAMAVHIGGEKSHTKKRAA